MYFVRAHGPYSALICGYFRNISRRRAACGSGSFDQTKPCSGCNAPSEAAGVERDEDESVGSDTPLIVPRLWLAVDDKSVAELWIAVESARNR